MNIDDHILQALQTHASGDRPVTLGDLTRQLGTNPAVILDAARRLVANGRAQPAMVSIHGVPTLRGLLPAASTTARGTQPPGTATT